MFSLAKSVFSAYIIWAVVILARTLWLYYFREHQTGLSEEMVSWVQFHSLAIALVLLSVGAVLSWRTQKGSRWARLLFIAFCLTYAVDALLGSFSVGPVYESLPPYSFFRGPVSFTIWCYLMALAWFTHSNNSFKVAPSGRDVPYRHAP
mgnify:CR=1 FL=1